MGLCKCPKRKVTNQFCFEHRVNVCEHCMVHSHPKCVVQSYLQWLQDSDYSPQCQLCQHDLASEQCVRLACYHVFHWVCLDQSLRQLPPSTAPAGYTCPSCQECVFPQQNLVSPVADNLRERLKDVNWARAGLGLPLLEQERERRPEFTQQQQQQQQQQDVMQKAPAGPRPTPEGENSSVEVHHSHPGGAGGVAYENTTTSRGKAAAGGGGGGGASSSTHLDLSELSKSPLLKEPDNDDNKYKRKSALELLQRYLRSLTSGGLGGRRSPGGKIQRYFMIGLLLFFVFLTFLVVMNYLGRSGDYTDPMLEPLNNPNIHVGQ